MKVNKITINRGVTVNMGNYESARFDVAFTAELTTAEVQKVKATTKKLDAMVVAELGALVLTTCNDEALAQFGLDK